MTIDVGERGSVPSVRLTDFWDRMETHLGPAYARSWAHDMVLAQLGGRTVDQALAAARTPRTSGARSPPASSSRRASDESPAQHSGSDRHGAGRCVHDGAVRPPATRPSPVSTADASHGDRPGHRADGPGLRHADLQRDDGQPADRHAVHGRRPGRGPREGSRQARPAVRTYHVGGLFLAGRSHASVTSVATLTKYFQALVTTTTTDKVGLLVATDQEGGKVQVLQGPGFGTIPTALVQGTYGVATLRAKAKTWGTALAKAGVNLDLAPVGDVPVKGASNPPIAGYDREYGFTTARVTAKASAFAAGLGDAGVDASWKHFPGLGRVTANTDTKANVHDTVTTVTSTLLDPFRAAVKGGAPWMMVSLATYDRIDPKQPAAYSSEGHHQPAARAPRLQRRRRLRRPRRQVGGLAPGGRAGRRADLRRGRRGPHRRDLAARSDGRRSTCASRCLVDLPGASEGLGPAGADRQERPRTRPGVSLGLEQPFDLRCTGGTRSGTSPQISGRICRAVSGDF